jgi:hypothetical protein
MVIPLVVIDNLNFVSAVLGPDEANAPSSVDPDAMLTCSVAAKQFQAISRDCVQVSQCRRAFYHLKFSYSRLLKALKARNPPAFE